MGQNNSTARNPGDRRVPGSRPFTQLIPDEHDSSNGPSPTDSSGDNSQHISGTLNVQSRPQSQHRSVSQTISSLRRRVSRRTGYTSHPASAVERSALRRNLESDELEHSPLVEEEEIVEGHHQIHSTRHQHPEGGTSVVERIGSRIMPRYAQVGTEGDVHRNGGGRFLRRRLSDSAPSSILTENPTTLRRRPLSYIGLSPSSSSFLQSHTRRLVPSISAPYPINSTDNLSSGDGFTSLTSTLVPETDQAYSPGPNTRSSRRSRLMRVRNSISGSFDTIFSSSDSSSSSGHPPSSAGRQPQTPPRRPHRDATVEETDSLLPGVAALQPNSTGSTNDHEDQAGAGLESASTLPATAFTPLSSNGDRLGRIISSSDLVASLHDRATQARESADQPSLLRRRSSIRVSRDNMPLSEVLRLAAATVARQLAGDGRERSENTAMSGDDGLTGLVEGADLSTNANVQDLQTTVGEGSPFTVWQVYRYVNFGDSRNNTRRFMRTLHPSTDANEAGEGSTITPSNENRSVTIVVVSVRSVRTADLANERRNRAQAGFSEVLRIPFIPALDPTRRHSGSQSNFSDAGTRPYPFQRHQRVRSAGSTAHSTPGTATPVTPSIPMVLSESPPGPIPPPSTPADTYLSRTTTPSRRPSSASAAQHFNQSQHDHLEGLREGQETVSELPPPQISVRHRRRSDSEAARHRVLGHGSSRRNGVVEPEGNEGRSWLIYVVGTNIAEDHPAFTAQSLMGDNPTYEDMLMLSSLLGPVKPPVASRQDVEAAGGIYRVRWAELDRSLQATGINQEGTLNILPDQTCLVCLSPYEVDEYVRQLERCNHAFHRDCIDEWLTTGRNSCPLCRGQGVEEKNSSSPVLDPSDGDVEDERTFEV